MYTNLNTYSVTDLRQKTSKILNEAEDNGFVNIVQNSKPKVVVVSPQYLFALQEAYEDYLDNIEFDETINLKRTPFKKVLEEIQKA
ncbi:type II toxin-antitoxin system Phd/YefM family antitoxin [Patescibacteria group bacterium]|nr:type II toxin-antitoxin system Phd/YefM family antitoxin [Patescibacteria group bacterium]MBU1256399.1 type II toxin-antitoxin system Phd/YefM family antitoxin [Patescibacteria group bacterium]MBU1457426.1 type II toxin-antitoxin system Phd/YefM family antitoxin [Patescibacteria group bacterium]